MSGIFGIFNRNGKPVEEKIVDAMLDTMSNWDPDERDTYIDGPLALGHAMLWNTPESKYEHLPLKKDVYILTMDARIDNRDELLQQLELPNRPLEEIGDSEFVLSAYMQWGEDCPKHLLGDFAFVIWDEKKQQLFCARDHIGIKLFHFYLSDDLFVFGNDIEGILAHIDVPKILDDKTVATFLKDEGIHTKRDTFFEKIKKLPAATTLIITKSSVSEKKYWHIEKSPPINFETYDMYVQRLKELFDSAVEARLRTVFPIASHLSGGIDSSPIAVLAARKLKKRNQELYAFNWINVPENDEYEYEAWSFSRRIAETENIIHKEFTIDPQFIVKQYEEHNFLTRGTMYYWGEYAVQDMVKDINARTVLSGWGGDELISHSGSTYISDLFSKGKLLKVFRNLLYEKKYLKYSWALFIKRVFRLFLSSNIIRILRDKRVVDKIGQNFYHQCITKEFSKFMNTHEIKKFPRELEVRKKQLIMYNYGHLQNRIESWALSAYRKRMEYRYPLLDKKIVEFAMGIPEEIFYPKEGIGRHLMKSTVVDLLPSDIVWFPKGNESKINTERQTQYIAALKIMQQVYKDMDDQNMDDQCKNKYVEYNKMKVLLETFDFEKINSSLPTFDLEKFNSPLLTVATRIQLVNSMKKIQELS